MMISSVVNCHTLCLYAFCSSVQPAMITNMWSLTFCLMVSCQCTMHEATLQVPTPHVHNCAATPAALWRLMDVFLLPTLTSRLSTDRVCNKGGEQEGDPDNKTTPSMLTACYPILIHHTQYTARFNLPSGRPCFKTIVHATERYCNPSLVCTCMHRQNGKLISMEQQTNYY